MFPCEALHVLGGTVCACSIYVCVWGQAHGQVQSACQTSYVTNSPQVGGGGGVYLGLYMCLSFSRPRGDLSGPKCGMSSGQAPSQVSLIISLFMIWPCAIDPHTPSSLSWLMQPPPHTLLFIHLQQITVTLTHWLWGFWSSSGLFVWQPVQSK